MIIRYLEILEAVAQTKSFTGAAKKLYITQSAVSHAVAELERQAGTALFDRLPRGVRLTRCGEALLKEAQMTLASCRNLEKKMGCLEETTPINIASSITIASFLLPEILNEIRKQMPKLQVRVQVSRAADTREALQSGKADLAFFEGPKPKGNFCTKLLGSYRICAACASDFPLKKESLTAEEIVSYPLLLRECGSAIRDTFDGMLSLANQKAYPVWESVNSFSLIKAAEGKLGITILPKILLADALEEKRLRLIEIEGVSLENKMFAVVHRDRYMTHPVENLLNYMNDKYCLI